MKGSVFAVVFSVITIGLFVTFIILMKNVNPEPMDEKVISLTMPEAYVDTRRMLVDDEAYSDDYSEPENQIARDIHANHNWQPFIQISKLDTPFKSTQAATEAPIHEDMTKTTNITTTVNKPYVDEKNNIDSLFVGNINPPDEFGVVDHRVKVIGKNENETIVLIS